MKRELTILTLIGGLSFMMNCQPDKKGEQRLTGKDSVSGKEIKADYIHSTKGVKHGYDTLRVDPGLAASPVFHLIMDQLTEPASYWEAVVQQTPSSKKASSTVQLIKLWDKQDWVETHDQMICRARVEQDTLQIEVSASSGNGHVRDGIRIKVKNGLFRSQPYSYSAMDAKQSPSIITISKQKLTLNKVGPQVGDTLYGKIYLRARGADSVAIYAQGYFRARIENSKD